MKIVITPEDLILRCLWSNYKKFVLFDKSENDIIDIVKNNEPTIISEEHAYVIGLLKVIETDNIIHRFNQHIIEILQLKSNVFDDDIYINRNAIIKEITVYKSKFPTYYTPPLNYKKAIDDLLIYIDNMLKIVENFEIFKFKIKDNTYEYLLSKDIKKQLKM